MTNIPKKLEKKLGLDSINDIWFHANFGDDDKGSWGRGFNQAVDQANAREEWIVGELEKCSKKVRNGHDHYTAHWIDNLIKTIKGE